MSHKEVNKTNSKQKVGKTKTVELTPTLDLQDGDKSYYLRKIIN